MYQIIEKWLTPNKYSRPQKPLNKIKGIVIHWVANPMSKAISNRNYFESKKYGTPNPKTGKPDYCSAHEIIGLDGEIVKCVPYNEIVYAVGSNTYTQKALQELSSYPNDCTYNIECCHIDWSGKMNDKTYNTLVERCVDLCKQFNLNPYEDLWLHKEVVGWKDCHKWFVDNPDEWKLFKQKVSNIMNKKSKYFNDIPENFWNIDDIDKAYELGIINGYPDGTFKPNITPTRAEMTSALLKLYKKIKEEIKNG